MLKSLLALEVIKLSWTLLRTELEKQDKFVELNKDEITANYDLLVFEKDEQKLDYKNVNVVIQFGTLLLDSYQ